MKIDNQLLFNMYKNSFQKYTHFLVDFFREIKGIIVLKKMNPRYKKVIKAKFIKFEEQVEREPIILNIMNKIKILKIAAKV